MSNSGGFQSDCQCAGISPLTGAVAGIVSQPFGPEFRLTIPQGIQASQSITVSGYSEPALLTKIYGGVNGQIVVLTRTANERFTIAPNQQLRLSSNMEFNDTLQLNNITIQRIDASRWVELSRTSF
jgi:hypothetical protein